MVRAYSERLEIRFWDYLIPLMRGESPMSHLVQALLPITLAVARHRVLLLRIMKFLLLAGAGFILGLILGFLRARLG